ncbi:MULTISPECIES: Holliday junction resolvase RuvX [Clavibacter]|jgi:putative Holliday junction resolvase|uniref:Putative pre-16S rRNA nuclease n=3 Tax=Clavibacter TaxID=1573 RepID=A0A251Y2C5_9MICO|nr:MULTISPECIES: Holliday junction resolvase RuvX [Clavibacter]KXU20363.1 crossover junction endodeoxyribonuclease RuvA [Clavibacter nebraskensis]OAH20731.1 crossover junction endodeoxyribonuclease RuvA [Clavibacter nebraskensis]OUE18457.1 putative Holliday junction resolvase [Clavibacter michiganensis]QGV66920.1 Holliday junction resolvase RuvX [Clavibacter nebraskensis]QGV69721.1 Holliday junction resolvase RuvX [Clavibacter nebraskensis]
MRIGSRLAVDVGKARIGLARSDPHGLIATPVETVPRDAGGSADVRRILEVAAEIDCAELVVGLPLALSGRATASTDDAEGFARRLADATGIPVRLVDERLSTVSAQGALRASGRGSRKQKPVIDQVAAVIILQHALETERAAGSPPGALVPRNRVDPDRHA